MIQGTGATLKLAAGAGPADRDALQDVFALYDASRPGGSGTAMLWQALQAGTTRAELVSRLASEYKMDRVQAAAGADRFVDQLRRTGLLIEC